MEMKLKCNGAELEQLGQEEQEAALRQLFV